MINYVWVICRGLLYHNNDHNRPLSPKKKIDFPLEHALSKTMQWHLVPSYKSSLFWWFLIHALYLIIYHQNPDTKTKYSRVFIPTLQYVCVTHSFITLHSKSETKRERERKKDFFACLVVHVDSLLNFSELAPKKRWWVYIVLKHTEIKIRVEQETGIHKKETRLRVRMLIFQEHKT